VFSIPDITISDYFKLNEVSALRYDIYINSIKPVNRFCSRVLDTSKLTYEQVELMKITFRNPTIEDIMDLFIMLYKIRGDVQTSAAEVFFNESIFNLFRAKNFLQEFITGIIEKEKNMLTGATDEKSKMVNAGERLAPVSYILTKNKLAERFSCMPRDIAQMKYSEVFLILLADKMYADVSHDYNQIT